jgi:hypothetical protein
MNANDRTRFLFLLTTGVSSPMSWGDEPTVRSRLQAFAEVRLSRRIALMRYPFPPAETVEFSRRYYGPTQRAFASLDASVQARLRQDLVDFQTSHNIAKTPNTTEVAAEYLEVIAVRAEQMSPELRRNKPNICIKKKISPD